MSRVLIGIAVVTTCLALSISIVANAATDQIQGGIEQKANGANLDSQPSDHQLKLNDGRLQDRGQFPLMLPQPTKIDNLDKYDLG